MSAVTEASWVSEATIEQRLAAAAAAWQGEIVYHVLVDRFHSSSHPLAERRARSPHLFHEGDLRGLRDKLSYIVDLGATALWIGPLYLQRSRQVFDGVSRDPYHGYHPWDFRAVDPHFGTLEDLRDLVGRAHDLGLKVILDMVVNHTGHQFPGLPEHGLSPVGDDRAGTFHHLGELNTDSPASVWEDAYALENFDLFKLPDLDQDNPVVADYLVGSARWWLEHSRGGTRADGSPDTLGIDGIRMDTVKHVSRLFWREAWHPRVTFDEALNAARPGQLVFTVAELLHGSPEVVAAYQHEGFPSALDFPFHYALVDAFARGRSMRGLADVLGRDAVYLDPHLLVTFIDNHDVTRFAEEARRGAGGDEREARRRLRSALTLQMACRGIPCVYYGTELAIGGADPIMGRHDLHAWSTEERSDAENEVFTHLQSLCRLRKRTPVLTHGRQRIVAADDDVLVIARELGDETVLVVARTPRAAGESRMIRVSHGHTPGVPGARRVLSELLEPEGQASPATLDGDAVGVEVPCGGVRLLHIATAPSRPEPVWTPLLPDAATDVPPRPRPYPIRVGDQRAWVHDDGFAAGYFHTYDALRVGPRGEARKVHLFLPRGYCAARESYPLLVMNDGHTTFWPGGLANQTWGVAGTLAAEYASGRVKPLLVMAVVPSDRERDYSLAAPGRVDAYVEWLDGALAFVEQRYRVSRRAADHAIVGASRGGLAAFRIATTRPERFGNAAAMSPSFWHGLDAPARPLQRSPLVDDVASLLAAPARRPRLWLDWGTSAGGHPSAVRIEQQTRARALEMAELLRAEFGYVPGHELLTLEDEQGQHDEASWGPRFPQVLRCFFAR
jgi:glycosidase